MFHIICLVKFIPDIQNFEYDYDRNVLVRENTRLIINPDDACALALALKMKEHVEDVRVQVLSMGPQGVISQLRDLLRIGVDEAVLLSDKSFAGSDTIVTTNILCRFLEKSPYDLILSGSHTLDGDTAHVPSQTAEYLGLPQMSGITALDVEQCSKWAVLCEVDDDDFLSRYKISLPALLGVAYNAKLKLPFVRFDDLEKHVDDRIRILCAEDLGLEEGQLGLTGSPTKVVKTHTKEHSPRKQVVVKADEEGAEYVYQFLLSKGFIDNE